MALIDPRGLFYGERLGDCSDEAQLHWPRLFAASNGYGRIELSYERLCDTVYQSFKKRPTAAQLSSWFQEYQKHYLLFVYEAPDGAIWGQWITSEKFLPRHKTAADRTSPAPDPDALKSYRDSYIQDRKSKYLSFQSFHKSSENFGNVPKISEDFGKFPRGVGEGDGEGKDSLVVSDEPPEREVIEGAFRFYCQKLGRDPARYSLTPKRLNAAVLRYRERLKIRGDPQEAKRDLAKAITNLAESEYHVTHGYVDWLDQIFRSAEEFEKRLNWEKQPTPQPRLNLKLTDLGALQ